MIGIKNVKNGSINIDMMEFFRKAAFISFLFIFVNNK